MVCCTHVLHKFILIRIYRFSFFVYVCIDVSEHAEWCVSYISMLIGCYFSNQHLNSKSNPTVEAFLLCEALFVIFNRVAPYKND